MALTHVQFLRPGWQHVRSDQVAAALHTDSRGVPLSVIVRLVLTPHVARNGGVRHFVGLGVDHAPAYLCHPRQM